MTPRNLPPLNALRAFEAAGRHESFTLAAKELHVTHGAISRHVKKLESYYRTALFRRSRGRVQLTERGRILASTVGNLLDRLGQLSEDLCRKESEILVRTPLTFAIRWLMPRLMRFKQSHPTLQVRLTAINDSLGPFDEDFDVAVIYGDPKRRGFHAQVLLPELMAPVCAPQTIQAAGTLEPAELRNQRLLLNMPDGGDWRIWAAENGVPDLPLNRALIFEFDDPAIQAAVAGHGIALANVRFVENELRAGTLTLAVRAPPTEIGKYYVVYPEHFGGESRLVSFRDWLLAEAAAPDDW